MRRYIISILLILLLLTGCSGKSEGTKIITDENRTDFPSVSDIQQVRPGMNYEKINDLLGNPYECISNGETIEISYKLENDATYMIMLQEENDGQLYVNAIRLSSKSDHFNLSGTFDHSKWKFIWPTVGNACKVNLGMTFNQVKDLLGLPQYCKGSGLIREVYYLGGGYSAELYYSISSNAEEYTVIIIHILPLTWEGDPNYYLITIANIIIPILIAAAIILVLVICYRRYKIKRV